eukprot:TRINITY_DN7449_c0_g1_i4.p4 TRINITY_DN7449_c0_g1~~TRINITY_DN7449_c0_g1_i4.p4  ORF type:complete len:131 (-),score=11.91 TRINITY_DN7449_c0_g1_i4:207-599(-)
MLNLNVGQRCSRRKEQQKLDVGYVLVFAWWDHMQSCFGGALKGFLCKILMSDNTALGQSSNKDEMRDVFWFLHDVIICQVVLVVLCRGFICQILMSDSAALGEKSNRNQMQDTFWFLHGGIICRVVLVVH